MNHLAHVEDTVLEGSTSIVQTLTELQSINTVSLKFDGKIGIVFGFDRNGDFQLVCKHQFDKIRQNKAVWSTIRDYDVSRNSIRENLWTFEKHIKEELAKSIPVLTDIFWFGDLLYQCTPDIINKHYTFKPNVVEYKIYSCSKYGKQLKNSTAGIAIHTCYNLNNNTVTPVHDISDFDNNTVLFFNHYFNINPIKIPSQHLSVVYDTINDVDMFINTITSMKAKSALTSVGPFITKMIHENDITSDLEERFIKFLDTRLSQSANQKLLNNGNGWLYSKTGSDCLTSFWDCWKALYNIKHHIKNHIDKKIKSYHVKGYINNLLHHEGYVVGFNKKLKIVDRLVFSKANFSKFNVSDEEKLQKASMPVASICYGRCNPPTLGHKLLFEKTIKLSENAFIFLSNTTGKKDPLSFDEKVQFIEKMYPTVAQYIVKQSFDSPIKIMNYLYNKGYRNIAVVAGSDRLTNTPGSLRYLLEAWNSGPIRTNDTAFGEQGREYVHITYHCCGERANNTNTVTGFSSTKARDAVVNNQEKQFWKFVGNFDYVKVNKKNMFETLTSVIGKQS